MEMEQDKRDDQATSADQLIPENNSGEHATLQSEADLSDHHDEEHHHDDQEHEVVDYSLLTKKELVEVLKVVAAEPDFKKIDRTLHDIRPAFDELKERDRTTALNRFILDGSNPEDFEYRGDELDNAFESLYKQLRDKRAQYLRSLEDNRNDNLRKKERLLEELRDLIDGKEGLDQFEKFKEFQKQWKSIGAVPGPQAKTLWANYHALIDRFYDNQNIYFELKELDRKRNLEAKIDLCARAEKLSEVEKIKDAVKELNELHHEFKHIGPVPKDDKEDVWLRFKAASDAVYSRRDEYLKTLQQELAINQEKKERMAQEVEAFVEFNTDRIKEWNQKTKEILDLQKKWDAIGGLPRAKAKEINKKFWSSFKTFFSNKNAFFKKLDESRESNLRLKEELVQRAIALRDSDDWDKTAQELKNLQQKWKEIGPVPEKFREKIFAEFKQACDHFFDLKRQHLGKQGNDQIENLKAKVSICELLEKHVGEKTANPKILKSLEAQFSEIGFVPKKDINMIRNRYHEAVQKFVDSMEDVTDEDKSRLMLENQLADLKNDPMGDRKIYQKEQAIRKRISKVENDIALWRNNLEFFARSSNAEKVRDEFNEKINSASDQLKQLKEQLKLLRTV